LSILPKALATSFLSRTVEKVCSIPHFLTKSSPEITLLNALVAFLVLTKENTLVGSKRFCTAEEILKKIRDLP
jgi:hypothetical protein